MQYSRARETQCARPVRRQPADRGLGHEPGQHGSVPVGREPGHCHQLAVRPVKTDRVHHRHAGARPVLRGRAHRTRHALMEGWLDHAVQPPRRTRQVRRREHARRDPYLRLLQQRSAGFVHGHEARDRPVENRRHLQGQVRRAEGRVSKRSDHLRAAMHVPKRPDPGQVAHHERPARGHRHDQRLQDAPILGAHPVHIHVVGRGDYGLHRRGLGARQGANRVRHGAPHRRGCRQARTDHRPEARTTPHLIHANRIPEPVCRAQTLANHQRHHVQRRRERRNPLQGTGSNYPLLPSDTLTLQAGTYSVSPNKDMYMELFNGSTTIIGKSNPVKSIPAGNYTPKLVVINGNPIDETVYPRLVRTDQ